MSTRPPNPPPPEGGGPNPPPPEGGPWTISRVLQWTRNHFEALEIDSARTTAEALLAHALGVRRLELYLNFDQPLQPEELARYRQLIRRRCRREPLAYITGQREFWSMAINVDPQVLIPRPDSECLVEQALTHIPEPKAGQRVRVLELGVGSGAIILALAKHRPRHLYFGSDRSPGALQLARTNAVRHGLDDTVHLFAADWLAAVKQRQCFDLVVSNPPYIPTGILARLQPEIFQYEPLGALDGGDDGLDAIGAILDQAPDVLVSGGHLLVEIGYDQAEAVQALTANAPQLRFERVYRDYGGHDRVVQWQRR